MGIDFLISLAAALASLAVGGAAASDVVQKLLRQILGRKPPPKPYSERLAELTAGLSKASHEVDSVLAELAQVARERTDAVDKLETELATLEGRERELKEKIDALQKTPLPMAEHFAKLIESGEKRSARRDYALFGAGVLVTTVVAILIQLFAH
jgi:chromosome segregation ATPase